MGVKSQNMMIEDLHTKWICSLNNLSQALNKSENMTLHYATLIS
jgi:hypothetical protein